ncbi:MAG: aminotransferase class I/II-fold pyridoxal phosphate-dependent enzyme [Candidatus Aminicenantes bacterium]|nr:aminotransferase class I/II-fold pyridoxal phosphate-dependent enzyme [Candidatus Aminicenantes bacterium]
MDKYSDFRSDTVTRPTPNMRKAMAEAIVGDDVLGDDPTVQKLEEMSAGMMGKDAAVFMPSGTMGNSVAIKAWTRELEEVIVEAKSHIYNMESTHMTFISRVLPRVLNSNRGAMDPDDIEKNIRKSSVHIPKTSLICVENTHNNWSGAVVPLDNLKEIRKIADKHEIKVHLDGARIFNASHATKIPVKDYAAIADSVMFCLSKGLSAPIGSMLIGPREFIDMARRVRKALGGGMRQVGIIAAAGLVALTEMVDRIQEDNIRAKKLALAIAGFPGIKLEPEFIQTNIVIFGFNHPRLTVSEFLNRLNERGILALQVSKKEIRFVTHKDVDDEDVDRAISAFRAILT